MTTGQYEERERCPGGLGGSVLGLGQPERAAATGWETLGVARSVAEQATYNRHLAEGDWNAASAHLRAARTGAERYRDLQGQRHASAVLAELDVLQGRPETAIARLVPLLDRPRCFQQDYAAYASGWVGSS
jgi:hypothetical protein